ARLQQAWRVRCNAGVSRGTMMLHRRGKPLKSCFCCRNDLERPVPTSTAHRNQIAATGIQPRPSLPVDDVRIKEIMELAPPAHLLREFPVSERAAKTTYENRQAIHRVLHGADDRLLVIVGPCSIHDYDAAIDYATRLAAIKPELASELIVV